MKGLISGIKRMEIHDGDGIRTTVFFKGCPLRCVWCHNPESISFTPQTAYFYDKCVGCNSCGGIHNFLGARLCPSGALVEYGIEYSADVLAEILAKDLPFFKNSGGGVTLSGGECLAQPDFCVELARILSEGGISVYIDTSGFAPRSVFERIIRYTDKFLYDVKAIDSEVHKVCTGQDNSIILDNLRYISELGCKIEIRYPLVVGMNDGECEKIAGFLSKLSNIELVRVLRYHNLSASRYAALGLECTLPEPKTTPEDVDRAINIFRSFGLMSDK